MSMPPPTKKNYLLPLALVFGSSIAGYGANQALNGVPRPDKDTMIVQELTARLVQAEQRVQVLEGSLREVQNRQSVLGTVSDENVAVLRDIIPDPRSKYLIWIDPSWKINRMPSHLKFDDAGRDFIKSRVNE